MTRIVSMVEIALPAAQVFDFATTPGHWQEWHPASLAVRGATDHPLAQGEQVEEIFRLLGRRGRVIWTVRERVAARRWVIEGRVVAGGAGRGTITYTLTPTAEGTRFVREFLYTVPPGPLALLDRLVLRRRITAESDHALMQLKQHLEDLAIPH